MLRKFLFLLASGLLACQAALAQQVLFLSTNETADGGLTNNAYTAFAANTVVTSLGGVVDGRGWLSNTTALDPAIFDGKKVVVLTTTYVQMNPAQVPVLRDAILNRPDLTFVMFPDGCCQTATNLTPIINILNAGTGWGMTGAFHGSTIAAPLNTNSLYQSSFTSLNPMKGGWYWLLSNVPSDNALYLAQGATPPVTGTRTSAYSLFVPQRRFNGGRGACVFLTADISPFGISTTQSNSIADVFMNAATSSTGACAQSTREPDLVASVTGPAAPTIGSPATYTLIVANEGATNSPATTATMTVPAGMSIDTASLPAACTAAGQVVTCNVGALAATTGTVSFPINVTPTQPGAVNVSASVTTVAGETSTANNSTTMAVAPAGAPDLVPSVSGPASPVVGTPSTYTLSVTNQGNLAGNDGNVTLTVPTGMTVGPLPPGCAQAGQTITCTVTGPLNPTATQSWPITLTPTQAGPLALQTDVTGVTGETNTTNNTQTTNVTAVAAPAAGGVTAVPTLDLWALLALSGLLPLVARRRRG